jgi:hypothetical protein
LLSKATDAGPNLVSVIAMTWGAACSLSANLIREASSKRLSSKELALVDQHNKLPESAEGDGGVGVDGALVRIEKNCEIYPCIGLLFDALDDVVAVAAAGFAVLFLAFWRSPLTADSGRRSIFVQLQIWSNQPV